MEVATNLNEAHSRRRAIPSTAASVSSRRPAGWPRARASTG